MRIRTLAAVATAVIAAGGIGLTVTAAQAEEAAPTAAQVQAVPGYQVVRLPNANVPNFQRRYAYCPAGKVAIGGGAEARGNEAILVGSFPTDGNNGWIGLGRQPGHNDVGISVFVICADA
ncbi:hypothetical protein Misp01_62500 [Microtetraspora sp. NBRC 13810]|uniref:hypothetical protein n=1 Tax=Microtetraspora sp. NBRC 13810 TaxID=3030990 RepID=UPI0024A24FBF|nr:hypothetical protein [Microtetraspora sp. NBRC 13810]GLW11122.1 hypothetical protein Misp01_62500 [Microtetraspora sp. NBRC 13810]